MPASKKNDEILHRSFSLRLDSGKRPASLNEGARTVEVVAATEAPCPVFDYKTWETWLEILPVKRAKLPNKSPLLDAHNRWSTADIIGSSKGWRVEGEEIIAVAEFATVKKAETAFQLLREGHLTDVSIGYRVNKYLRIEKDETHEVDGKSYDGPVLIALDWEIKELSFCPIGADADAKARALEGHKQQEESNMNEWLKRMAAKLGLSEDATEEQVREAVETEIAKREDAGEDFAELVEPKDGKRAEPDDDGKVIPLDDVRSVVKSELGKQRKAELDSAREITDLCKAHDMEERAGDMISRGLTVQAAMAEVLAEIGKRDHGEFPGFGRVEMGADGGDKLRAAVVDGLLMRSDVVVDAPVAGADDFRGMRMDRIAEECLRASGQPVPNNAMELIGRALTTSDLPTILSETSRRAVLAGFETAEETWQTWCGVGSVSDFKVNSLISVGLFGDLSEVGEDGEIDAAYIEAVTEALQLVTFAKTFPITRQAIINDDLGVLVDVPNAMGAAAARTVGNLPYAVLDANQAMSDGIALFHADHGNLASSGSDVSVDSLSAGEDAMAEQKDPGGEATLGISPRFFLSGTKGRAKREQFFKTTEIGGKTNQPNLANPYAGGLERVYDHRLNGTKNKWFLSGRKGTTVKVVFLNGVQTPRVETKQGWNPEGVVHKVAIDAAAAAASHRALYSNPGV